MKESSRIPELKEATFDGALLWFSQMQQADLLFHPEDAPDTIVHVESGEKVFSSDEVGEIRFVLDRLEEEIGHDMLVNAAYPIFMKAMGIMLDS